MKINKRSKDVQAIRFVHSGMELKYINVLPPKYMSHAENVPGYEILQIEFCDTEEIVMLMRMLEHFLGETRLFHGEWRIEK